MHRGVRREFIGFNRARHAVLEAAIYATRLHLLPRTFIESELARLQVIVDKTAGPDEFEAMALLAEHVRSAPLDPHRMTQQEAGTVFVEGGSAAPLRRARSSRRPRTMVRWLGTAAPAPTLLVSATAADALHVAGAGRGARG